MLNAGPMHAQDLLSTGDEHGNSAAKPLCFAIQDQAIIGRVYGKTR